MVDTHFERKSRLPVLVLMGNIGICQRLCRCDCTGRLRCACFSCILLPATDFIVSQSEHEGKRRKGERERMPTPQNPHQREHPSTYVVQDRQNQQELMRLTIQDHLITASMGGVLPEQPDAASFRRILDVGCATGGWVIEAAKTSPAMSLCGIDISRAMIEYAQSQATEQ